MKFEWRADAAATLAAVVKRSQDAVASVSRDYSGHPVAEVKRALKAAWEGANDGASITDPELTLAAKAVSDGKRLWLEDDGGLMVED